MSKGVKIFRNFPADQVQINISQEANKGEKSKIFKNFLQNTSNL